MNHRLTVRQEYLVWRNCHISSKSQCVSAVRDKFRQLGQYWKYRRRLGAIISKEHPHFTVGELKF